MQNKIDDLLFVDIETVPLVDSFDKLSQEMCELWSVKANSVPKIKESLNEISIEDSYLKYSGVYAEFAKVVCISFGASYVKDGRRIFRIKSIAGDNERDILNSFSEVILSFSRKHSNGTFCGHNIKEFDIPFLCRRMIINDLPLPNVINIAGRKPWEISFVDTLDLWKFGDYKHYSSLRLLTTVLEIPTPKDDIDGGDVASVYHDEHNLERIVTYCQKDVLAVRRLYERFCGMVITSDDDVEIL